MMKKLKRLVLCFMAVLMLASAFPAKAQAAGYSNIQFRTNFSSEWCRTFIYNCKQTHCDIVTMTCGYKHGLLNKQDYVESKALLTYIVHRAGIFRSCYSKAIDTGYSFGSWNRTGGYSKYSVDHVKRTDNVFYKLELADSYTGITVR